MLKNEAIFKKITEELETREIYGSLTALTSQKSEKHAWFGVVRAKYASSFIHTMYFYGVG